MILMPQIFDATANENARYKRNELELLILDPLILLWKTPYRILFSANSSKLLHISE